MEIEEGEVEKWGNLWNDDGEGGEWEEKNEWREGMNNSEIDGVVGHSTQNREGFGV